MIINSLIVFSSSLWKNSPKRLCDYIHKMILVSLLRIYVVYLRILLFSHSVIISSFFHYIAVFSSLPVYLRYNHRLFPFLSLSAPHIFVFQPCFSPIDPKTNFLSLFIYYFFHCTYKENNHPYVSNTDCDKCAHN